MSDYQGSLLEFSLIKSKVEELSNSTGQNLSHSFTLLCLMQYLGLDQYTADDCIIDGSYDCGIDAIYFDTESQGRPVVYLVQSKYYQANKYNRAFEGSAIDKMLQSIDMLFLQPTRSRKYTSSVLDEKIRQYDEEIRDTIPKFKIIFCSNSYPPDAAALQKLGHWLEDRNSFSDDIFEHIGLHLREIAILLAPVQRKNIKENLRLSGEWFNYDSGSARTVVGRVSVEELSRIYKQHGEFLFDRNVRAFLKAKNKVNQNIRKTLVSDQSHEFFYLNNGITIVCNNLNYTPLNKDPVIEIEGLQIVNGGQTTHTVHLTFEENLVQNKEQVFVLVKIIEIKDDDNLLNNIADATNSQTAVTSRDLMSNDSTQKNIEEQLRTWGYYYEARAGKYSADEDIRPDQRVDAATAAQVWLAFNLQRPHESRRKKEIFQEPLYGEVFPSDLDARAYLDAYLLFKYIHRLGASRREDYPFINYAKFHIMAMLMRLGITNVKALEENQDKYDRILDAMQALVSKAQKVKGFKGYNGFFGEPTLLGRIAKEYEVMSPVIA
jgi:hypothetical protein